MKAVRQEIKEFIKTSERLISLARQTDELSSEECQILDYYVTELKSTVHPICIRKAGTISLPAR
jgi:hypothetical protein